jgi:hypothetical protein
MTFEDATQKMREFCETFDEGDQLDPDGPEHNFRRDLAKLLQKHFGWFTE